MLILQIKIILVLMTLLRNQMLLIQQIITLLQWEIGTAMKKQKRL